MATSTRDLKRRIRAVESTKQITKAMEMVAAAKLRRAEEMVVSGRPYAHKMGEVISRLLEYSRDLEHPLLDLRTVRNSGVVLVTGDRGLCGSYNANAIRFGQRLMESLPGDTAVVPVGRKGWDYFKRRRRILDRFINVGEEIRWSLVESVADTVTDFFLAEELDRVDIVYTEFVSPLVYRTRSLPLLPMNLVTQEGLPWVTSSSPEEGPRPEYIYEPPPSEVFSMVIPRFLRVQIYHALLESKASEHAARMTAMKNATDNANELIDKLVLQYNRARQEAITTEILEVVGGAEALRNV